MATLEDIVAATKILSEDPESIMENSCSKPEENRARASDGGVSAADIVGRNRVVESETIVESTFKEETKKFGVRLSSVSYSSSSVRVNGIDSKMNFDGFQDEFIKSGGGDETGEDDLAENGVKELNGSAREGNDMDVDGEGEGEGEGMGEKLKDQENVFHVGDFVWGKIRSHPWWPGQVCDPKDASDFALKRKQEGRLLVAFFGDGTCSWCLPSQLIPFVENFLEMSTDSSSKSFLNAVEMAIDEISRVVESEMSFNRISKEKKDGLARPVVENAGLKAGVLMPDVDLKRLSIPEFEAENVLEEVMQLAKGVPTEGGALNLAIMRSWLSAFYFYKGGYQLPVYHGPLHIEGLEDKNKNVGEVASDFSVPIEVPILGPQDDEWLASPTVGSANSRGEAEIKVSHKRKQKSVAELMKENNNIKPESRKRGSVKDGADFEKSKSPQKRKKSNDGEVSNEGGASTTKRGRKRKVDALESPKLTNAGDSNADSIGLGGSDGVNGGPLLRKHKEIEVASAENASGEAKEETEKVSRLRGRKKSNDVEVSNEGASTGKKGRKRKVKVLELPKLTNAGDLDADSSGLAGSNGVNGGPLLRKPKEIEVASAENASGKDKDEMEKVSSPRERKRSKYLSPPYTNPASRMGISSSRTELEVENDKTTKTAQVGEHKTEARGEDLASQPTPKSVDNASEEEPPNGQLERLNASDDRSPHTVKNDKKLSFSVSDVDAPVNELLSDIELAALDISYLSNKGSFHAVSAFVSALRSSTNLRGLDYKIYRKCEAGAKRKSLPSQLGKEHTQTKADSPKASKSEKKAGTSSSKKAAEASVGRSTMETVEGTSLPCLILPFATGFPLPSKKEIVGLFGKFGSLHRKQTKIDTASHSIRVVYTKDSDAEEAFKSSLKQNPFGSVNVDYRLQLASPGSKSQRSHPKVPSPLERAPEKQEAPGAPDDFVSDMNIIRQKLEITTAIMENYHSKFSSQDKSSLKDDMKHLMETVETVSDKVRVMAEKTAS